LVVKLPSSTAIAKEDDRARNVAAKTALFILQFVDGFGAAIDGFVMSAAPAIGVASLQVEFIDLLLPSVGTKY
jgi:hypothetical protein